MFEKQSSVGLARVGFLLVCGLLCIASFQSRGDERAIAPTQEEFAVKLAGALGHGGGGDGASAIERLSSLSIIPGRGPGAGWKPDAPATTKFVADIQASLQLLLKRAAEDLAIPPPPTLDLFVFELPPAPQKVFFPPEDQYAKRAPAAGVGSPDGTPTGAPSAAVRPPEVPPPPPMLADPGPRAAGEPLTVAPMPQPIPEPPTPRVPE
jgi:hypothetical protein